MLGREAKPPGFPWAMPWLFASIRGIFRSLNSIGENPAPGAARTMVGDPGAETGANARAAQRFFSALEDRAAGLGVVAVGYARLTRHFVFRDKAVLHTGAIVLAMEMDRDKIAMAPSMATAVMIHQTYARLGRAANVAADFLRARGFSAQAGHAVWGQVRLRSFRHRSAPQRGLGDGGIAARPLGSRSRKPGRGWAESAPTTFGHLHTGWPSRNPEWSIARPPARRRRRPHRRNAGLLRHGGGRA